MPLQPGAHIGIIGGGQLGRMLAMAAARLGFKCIILEPEKNCPASQVANGQIAARYDDEGALSELSSKCDVVTYEFENVPCETLAQTIERVPLYPPVRALEISQDRLSEKDFLNSIGVLTAPYEAVGNDSVSQVLEKFGNRAILKTRRLGYDGKGQVRLNDTSAEDARTAVTALAPAECLLEGFVDFKCEISVIAARNVEGEVACYDPALNVHREGILRTSSVPANVSDALLENARDITRKIVNALEYVGVIGIEFFVQRDGGLLVNEFAPRVHNSGHWTEAACPISQFEQHIRAICGLTLGDGTRHSDCVMENLIGDDLEKVPEILGDSGAVLHLYGKEITKPGRKMGHVTRLT